MKIGIFGKTSYIGTMFGKYSSYSVKYDIEYINSRDDLWKMQDFTQYDVFIYVAGIAHVSTNSKYEKQYFLVNRDLAIDVAQKAKKEGVSQFIFFSSMIVYKDSIEKGYQITADTIPCPSNFYGKSKLQAETEILAMSNDFFLVTIIRPPMVYGPGCKGNFASLVKFAKTMFFFPNYSNTRSVIYIENLCAFLVLCIQNHYQGIFFPQNLEFVSTKEIIEKIALFYKRKICFFTILNPFIDLLAKKNKYINKIFGDRTYDKLLSHDIKSYNLYSFDQSIIRCLKDS